MAEDPRTSVFDVNAETYSDGINESLSKYGTNHDFFTAHKAWLINDLLRVRERNPKSMRLLDVGCGVGQIHKYLRNDFGLVSGVDVSEPSLEVARKTYAEIDYRWYDGRRLPHDDRSFDISIAICVFHHVPPGQWSGLASEMLRVLAPGGISLIIEHNPFNPVTRRIVNNCPLDIDAVLLSPFQLRSLFRSAGGEDVVTRTVVSVPPSSRVLRQIDGWLGVLPFGAQYYMIAKKPK